MKTNLVIDANNLMYRTFFAHTAEDVSTIVGMAIHSTFVTLAMYYRKYRPDDIIMAFDSTSWRKRYTEDLDACVTNLKYKGTRRQNMTTSERKKFEVFDQHVEDFYILLKEQTSLLVLKKQLLEADDLIAGFIQSKPDESHILISADKDFMQLLGKNNLVLINPAENKPRTLAEYSNDPDYFIFEKCFRGDKGDNVMSAYPRIRKTKLQEAYKDEFVRNNILNHTFVGLILDSDGNAVEVTYATKEVFEENKLLMDLTAQPIPIRNSIDKAIKEAYETRGLFNYKNFLRYCGKHDLKTIIQSIDQYVPMLAVK